MSRKKINDLRRLRQQTGLSQLELSQLLGVSRSTCAMAETTGRPLPGQASLLAARMQVLLLQPAAEARNAARTLVKERLNKKQRQVLEKELDACRWQMITMQRKLLAMQQQSEACINLLELLQALKLQPLPGRDRELQRLWVQAAEANALQRLNQCHTGRQQVLQSRITALRQQQRQLEMATSDTG